MREENTRRVLGDSSDIFPLTFSAVALCLDLFVLYNVGLVGVLHVRMHTPVQYSHC
jgi:hypothetical protein